jgi:UDP-glucose 4-epimerase
MSSENEMIDKQSSINIPGKRILVTGGSGFVGSHIVDSLAGLGKDVVVFDNLGTGNKKFLEESVGKFELIDGDVLDEKRLSNVMEGIDFVFHMSANADIRENLKEPTKCLYQNTVATSNVLEAMRKKDVTGIAFPSTGSVYGEPGIHPTPENAPFPIQTSMYGASKLACEGLLEAYSVGYGFSVFNFRFVSLMGERYSHGCVYDFFRKLQKNPAELEILGDGKQKKSYLYVKDCVKAMLMAISSPKKKINTYNLGHDDYIEVTPIAKIVCDELGLGNVRFAYTGGKRGWVGDSPIIHLDTTKIKSIGWKPTISIEDCVRRTTRWLKNNTWVLGDRID